MDLYGFVLSFEGQFFSCLFVECSLQMKGLDSIYLLVLGIWKDSALLYVDANLIDATVEALVI